MLGRETPGSLVFGVHFGGETEVDLHAFSGGVSMK